MITANSNLIYNESVYPAKMRIYTDRGSLWEKYSTASNDMKKSAC